MASPFSPLDQYTDNGSGVTGSTPIVIAGRNPSNTIDKSWGSAIKIGEGKRSPYRISKKTIEQIHNALLLKQIQFIKKK